MEQITKMTMSHKQVLYETQMARTQQSVSTVAPESHSTGPKTSSALTTRTAQVCVLAL